jgi:hypothetical protein
VHAQGNIELLAVEGKPDIAVRGTTARFVENNEFDVWNVGHQRGLSLADNPGNFRIRPVVLQAADHGEGVTGIAYRR